MAALPFEASSTSCSGLGQAPRQPAAERVVIVGDENSTHTDLSLIWSSSHLVIWSMSIAINDQITR